MAITALCVSHCSRCSHTEVLVPQISVLAILCGVGTFHTRFQSSFFRPYRVGAYSALGIVPICSVIHGLVINGWQVQSQQLRFDWMLLASFIVSTGASVYVSRVGSSQTSMIIISLVKVPEKWSPGTFDIFGSSHQWLHFASILGAGAYLCGFLG